MTHRRSLRDIAVMTEDGRTALITFERGLVHDAWTVHISDELLAQSPQAIHAALGQAVMQMASKPER